MKSKREVELERCLEKTLVTLRRVDYWNNRNDYILADKQLFAAINRIRRTLGTRKRGK